MFTFAKKAAAAIVKTLGTAFGGNETSQNGEPGSEKNGKLGHFVD